MFPGAVKSANRALLKIYPRHMFFFFDILCSSGTDTIVQTNLDAVKTTVTDSPPLCQEKSFPFNTELVLAPADFRRYPSLRPI